MFATIPRDKLPPVREWTLNEDYQKGEIVDTTGQGHVHFIALVDNNSSNISNRKQPGTPDGVGTWDQLYTVDNPPSAGGGLPSAVLTTTVTNVGTSYKDSGINIPANANWMMIQTHGQGLWRFVRLADLPTGTVGVAIGGQIVIPDADMAQGRILELARNGNDLLVRITTGNAITYNLGYAFL